jgi:dTDP-4-dehydrorhamnose 3,5-epimerase
VSVTPAVGSQPRGQLDGVVVRQHVMHRDERGSVTEIFWSDGDFGFEPRQWHVLTSAAGTLRGMHVHVRHWDYKIVVAGRVTLVLKDLRGQWPAEDDAERLELSGGELVSVTIPPGVAHGVYSHDDSVTMVAASELYDPTDEYEFRWDDPELGVEWPVAPLHLSRRDLEAQSLASLVEQLRREGFLDRPYAGANGEAAAYSPSEATT